MPARRFRVAPGALDAEVVVLEDAEARHARVTRLRSGDEVVLFDGQGNMARGCLETNDAGATYSVRIERRLSGEADAPLRIVVVQAVPVKLQRLDETVRLCTEIGVAEIVPVLSARGQRSQLELPSVARRLGRWRRIAEAAAKQCGRAAVLRVHDAAPVLDLDWSSLPTPRFILDPAAATSLTQELAASEQDGCTLAVGPEGGWTRHELEHSIEQGGLGVRVGPRVLRADSAAVVAATLAQAAWGDLGC